MTGPEEDQSEQSKAPHKADKPITPHGAPEGSQPTSELNITDLTLGAIGGRFDLLAELGRGGMGIVYKARDRETNEIVALKVLKPEIAGRSELIERFKSELRLARKITHKNVCRTYDLHRFGDSVVIAMEFVEGESLRHILGRYAPLSPRKGVEWGREICSGLAEAHAQGVVHRDLKPENILIDKQGQAKVMDFGIARSLEASVQATGAILGTPAYMSPEQAEGKPADARSDIYSLGLILYEMFTGRPGLHADSPVALALKQIHETPPAAREVEPDLPHRLDRAIQKCLEKKPEKRYQTVAELEAALTEKAESTPATDAGGEVELPPHLIRWQRSDWLLVLAAIVGSALFFPFFNRTSIAPRSQVTFDRGALRRICEEYAQRLGAPVAGNPSMQVWWFGGQHDYVAKHSGAEAALELTNNPVPYWVWVMEWPSGTQVGVDHRGSFMSLSRNFPAAPAIERGPPDAARQLAEKDLGEFFGRDPSLLTLRLNPEATWSGQPATELRWLDPGDYAGLKRRYTVRVVGSQTAMLREEYGYPEAEANPAQDEGWQILPGIVIGLALLILGISQRRHVTFGARWHIAFVALGSFMGLEGGLVLAAPLSGVAKVLAAVFAGIAFAFVGFFFIFALERAIRRVWPNKLSSLVRVFDRRAISEPCGLAILRGTFVGLALLGVDSLLVWLATSQLGMRLDSAVLALEPPRSAMIGTGWSVTFVTIKEIYQAGIVAFILSFLTSFFARLVRARWVALCLAALVATAVNPWPMFNMAAVQPYPARFAILVLEFLLLTLTFSRFDVLTILWAAFAFAFCWANYYLLVMFWPTGALEEWIAFGIFGFFVAAAAAVAFKSPLRAGYRRLAAGLE